MAEKKEKYNMLEIGTLMLMSKDESMEELLKVADKILTKHKEFIHPERIKNIPSMYG